MAMEPRDCDMSPMKLQVESDLQQLILDIQHSLVSMRDENHCVLGNLDQIKQRFFQIESTAASFYLYCYLAPFTDKYPDLSLTIQHLSSRRHGALIVIERNEPLDQWIYKGTPYWGHGKQLAIGVHFLSRKSAARWRCADPRKLDCFSGECTASLRQQSG